MVNVKVNGIPVQVAEGSTVLEAAKKANVKIPTLCYNPDLSPWASCGICVVKIEGSNKMLRSCCTPVSEGMSIISNDPDLVQTRKTVIELILSTHPDDCLACPRNQACELQTLAQEFGIREQPYKKMVRDIPQDTSTGSLILNPSKCIRCGRCVEVCQEMQGVWAVEFLGRGESIRIAPAADVKLGDSPCIKCGQCSAHCPVGAIYENDQTKLVWDALMKEGPEAKTCAVQIAPAVRVALAESFGLPPGTDLTGKIYTALRRLGFDAVFDTNFSADLTIMEEGHELLFRLRKALVDKEPVALPMLTSCSPGWIKFIEQFHPEFIENLSTCKSPQQMMGAILKSYWARREGLDPEKIYSVAIMPCTAKKFECSRPEMIHDGVADIDAVLTTRELVQLVRMHGLKMTQLEPEVPDNPFGVRSTAGKLFGASGGVMEAALRTAHFMLTGTDAEPLEMTAVRGLDGIKESRVKIADLELGVAVVSGLANARKLVEQVKNGRRDIHFIEVMTCPGGCIAGGGQLIGADLEAIRARMQGLYALDSEGELRTSHGNPFIQRLYEEFLGEPLGERSHHLLHTHYGKRDVVL